MTDRCWHSVDRTFQSLKTLMEQFSLRVAVPSLEKLIQEWAVEEVLG